LDAPTSEWRAGSTGMWCVARARRDGADAVAQTAVLSESHIRPGISRGRCTFPARTRRARLHLPQLCAIRIDFAIRGTRRARKTICLGWDTILRRWDTKWDTILPWMGHHSVPMGHEMGHYSAPMGHHFVQVGHEMGHQSAKMGHKGTPTDTKMVSHSVMVNLWPSRGVSTRV
jgi:hypothetical protein